MFCKMPENNDTFLRHIEKSVLDPLENHSSREVLNISRSTDIRKRWPARKTEG